MPARSAAAEYSCGASICIRHARPFTDRWICYPEHWAPSYVARREAAARELEAKRLTAAQPKQYVPRFKSGVWGFFGLIAVLGIVAAVANLRPV